MNDSVPPPTLKEFQQSERNPFGQEMTIRPVTALASAEQQRVVAEVQARMIIARSNPRDQRRAMEAIINDCTRPSLAKDALYEYARGGSRVSGPSIRLAESVARRWGNIASGIKELSREGGYSECVAYAWDLETGYYDERQFQIRHWRDTKGGGYQLTDERDIYELIANLGQRRKRAVLLTVIPGDVIEAAVDQCEETLRTKVETSATALKALVEAFSAFGVTQQQIEKRCQCRLEAIRPAQIVQLRKIYTSLRDEMSAATDWFETTVWTDVEEARAAAPTKPIVTPPPRTAPRKAPAKKAVAPADEPPPGWDDESQDSAPAVSGEGSPSEPSGNPAAEAQPPEDGSNVPESSGAAAFEEWLLDENSDPIGDETYYDVRTWLIDFLRQLETSSRPLSLVEANADAYGQIRYRGEGAPDIIGRIEEICREARRNENDLPGVIVVPLTFDRGKPVVKAYLDAFRSEVAALVGGNFLDFVEMNRAEMAKVPQSTIGLCLKALVEKAKTLGVTVPPDLGPSLLQRAAPVQETSTEPAEDPDWKAARARAEEVRQCKDLNEVNAMAKGIIIVNFGVRLEREGKTEIIAFLKKAFDDRRAELKGTLA
jgi:hypothetical protein